MISREKGVGKALRKDRECYKEGKGLEKDRKDEEYGGDRRRRSGKG